MEDERNKRGLGLAITCVNEHNIEDFYNEGEFKQSVKSGVEQLFRPDIKDAQIKFMIDFYGLTGAGFQYKD